MKKTHRSIGMVGLGALGLAVLACTCGPLANLTGQVAATVESAATVAVEQVATAAVEVATAAPEIVEEQPTEARAFDPSLPVYDGGDGYETTLLERLAPDQPASADMATVFEAHNWVFEGTAGQTATVSVVGGSDEVDMRLRLFDPDGNVLAENDDAEGYNPLIVQLLPADGLYTARVDAFTEGPYTISVTFAEAGGEAQSGETLSQWAVSAWASSEYSNPAWSAAQATGAPDTDQCGDIETAWASENSDGADFLALEYAVPVIPTEINIYETYNPGAVVRVDVTDVPGNTVTIYEADPVVEETCPLVLSISVTGIDYPVVGVTVYVDQTNHPGWNEIDAVELVGTVP